MSNPEKPSPDIDKYLKSILNDEEYVNIVGIYQRIKENDRLVESRQVEQIPYSVINTERGFGGIIYLDNAVLEGPSKNKIVVPVVTEETIGIFHAITNSKFDIRWATRMAKKVREMAERKIDKVQASPYDRSFLDDPSCTDATPYYLFRELAKGGPNSFPSSVGEESREFIRGYTESVDTALVLLRKA